jgi:hypothetical protein
MSALFHPLTDTTRIDSSVSLSLARRSCVRYPDLLHFLQPGNSGRNIFILRCKEERAAAWPAAAP